MAIARQTAAEKVKSMARTTEMTIAVRTTSAVSGLNHFPDHIKINIRANKNAVYKIEGGTACEDDSCHTEK